MTNRNWSRTPRAERIDQLIQWVEAATTRITMTNFHDWLADVAYENEPHAACPNGGDHACNNGLGTWLGIEPYGQNVPWDKQLGYSADRFNVYANPRWINAVLQAPIGVQRGAYVDLLTTLRDRGEFEYRLPLVGMSDFSDMPTKLQATG